MVRLDPTPNPNSVKITVPVSVPKAMTYVTPDAADPLAAKLLGVPGVKSVFRVANFVTVTKDPATEWDAIAAKLASVVESHFA